jgi:hypothetical protein
MSIYLEAVISDPISQNCRTWGIIEDGKQPGTPGIIHLGHINNVKGTAGTPATWYTIKDNSDIGGYWKLQTAYSGKRTDITPLFYPGETPYEIGIGTFVTAAGLMDGIDSNNSAKQFDFIAWHTFSGSPVIKMRCEVYHRATDGTETLIAEFTKTITTSRARYTDPALRIDQSWGVNERLVFKYIGINEG